MKQVIAIGSVVLAMAAAPAFAQTASRPEQHPDAAKSSPKAAGKAMSDQQFVMNVAKDGMAEVELGKLAADKASSADVKKFAQKMVDDHSKANDELKTLAQNKNITLPAAPDAAHKAHVDRMSKLSGEAFDRAYMQDMVKDHQKAVQAFRMESQSGKDADVKAWAAKTLPTLEEHLKMAQDANKAVGTSGKK
jgi:putative membrane protein